MPAAFINKSSAYVCPVLRGQLHEQLGEREFGDALGALLLPGHSGGKPTYRQIIAHNIRHTDTAINNTLKVLNRFTTDVEYETLFLFMFGCAADHGARKESLRAQLAVEERFKNRLESQSTRAGYEAALAVLTTEVEALQKKREELGIAPDFDLRLSELHRVQTEIDLVSAAVQRVKIRTGLIRESLAKIEESRSRIDLDQLAALYRQATDLAPGITKSFGELLTFHNAMVTRKMEFLARELPQLGESETELQATLDGLLIQERQLAKELGHSEPMIVLEEIVEQLTTKAKRRGEIGALVGQLATVDENIGVLTAELDEIDDELFSEDSLLEIRTQLDKFNVFFARVSQRLYGESYALKVESKTSRKGHRVLDFSVINTNFSSGKKQGEISCFDIAYTLFADDNDIPCLHFLLNDKKELMHDNQLLAIQDLVREVGIQFVAPILRDKVPVQLAMSSHIALVLSQDDKLFQIEHWQPSVPDT